MSIKEALVTVASGRKPDGSAYDPRPPTHGLGVLEMISESPDWYISDEWARKAQEEKLAGLLKLEHRRVGYGAVEFEGVIKDLRRMLKNNEGAELRFEILVQVFDAAGGLGIVPRADPSKYDQTAASIRDEYNRSMRAKQEAEAASILTSANRS